MGTENAEPPKEKRKKTVSALEGQGHDDEGHSLQEKAIKDKTQEENIFLSIRD